MQFMSFSNVEQLKGKIVALAEDDFEKMKKNIIDLQEELTATQKEKELFRNEISGYIKRINEYRDENEQYEKEILNYQKESKIGNNTQRMLLCKIDELKAENLKLRKQGNMLERLETVEFELSNAQENIHDSLYTVHMLIKRLGKINESDSESSSNDSDTSEN